MKEKELIITLVKELMVMDELHEEYTDNNLHCVIDSQKEGDTLTIKVSLKENKDKQEFEDWVNRLDDDIFNETWESLSNEYGLKNLNDVYNTEDYKNVINMFKSTAREIAENKVKQLTKIFNL